MIVRGAQAGAGAGTRGAAGRGFTLIELLIVIAIVGVAAMAVGPAMGAITGANARAAAGEMSGSMRWLFDTAALRHTTCRMALDLDHAAWWAECVKPQQGSASAAARPGAEDEEALADRFPDERNPDARRLLARTSFGEYSDRQVRRRELPSGASFAEAWAEHQREAQTKGIAYVYFYPQGQAERAQVVVADGGGNAYTVLLQPLTGRARVVSGRREVPR